ncbi:TonB-dependent receptor plug domain-containing protein [Candidatus Hydrogenedentota bacterium]
MIKLSECLVFNVGCCKTPRTGPHRVVSRLLKFVAVILLITLVSQSSALAAEDSDNDEDSSELADMSLEDLLDIKITSVSKKKEKLREAASAIFVITQEDIRRTGVTSISEALRLAPGVHVARVNANRTIVSIRGFSDLYVGKLLVIIDGRSVYSPLFSGVYWEAQDTFMEDIERIEVIRGPGATLWGANAVNGVINIITKSAKDTQGGLLSGGGGTEERGFAGIRYGGTLDDDLYWRFYVKYFDRDGFPSDIGRDNDDNWNAIRSGFRIDWDISEEDTLTFQGDIYDGDAGQNMTGPRSFPPFNETFDDRYDVTGGNLLGRWTHSSGEDSEYSLQVYYDHTFHKEANIRERRHTFDVEFQHRLKLNLRHELTWGMGYRHTADDIKGSYTIMLDRDERSDMLVSAFVQDNITLVEDRLRLILGTKMEHNDYSGLEVQPSARLLWMPDDTQSIWVAVSRAVQTPSRSHHDMRINVARFPLGLVSIFGNKRRDSEELVAYELGYRIQPTETLSIQTALFYNVYDDLNTAEAGTPYFEFGPWPPHLTIPSTFDNNMEGRVYGIELDVNWHVSDRWRLAAGYSFLNMHLDRVHSSTSTTTEAAEDKSPRHTFYARSYFDITDNIELDVSAYYVDDLPYSQVPSYLRLDTRIGWHITEDMELSLSVKNILDKEHPEFDSNNGVGSTDIERSAYAKLTWKF